MKTKILLSVAALFAALTLSAQENNTEPHPSSGNWFIDLGAGINGVYNNKAFSGPGVAAEINIGKWVAPDWAFRFGVHGVNNKTLQDDRQWIGGPGNFFQLSGTIDLMWDPFTTFKGRDDDRLYNLQPYLRFATLAIGNDTPNNFELGAGAGIRNYFNLKDYMGAFIDLSAVASREQAFRNTGRFIFFPTVTVGFTLPLGKQGFKRGKDVVKEIVREVPVSCNHNDEIVSLKKEIDRLKNAPKEKEQVVVRESVNNMTVFFALGQSEIDRLEKDHLNTFFSEEMKRGEIVIVGMADSATGSTEANKTLSEKRAKAVQSYLIGHLGVKPANIKEVTGAGETSAFGARAEANRCVVISVATKQ